MFTAIPVSKGQKVILSVWAYNRLEKLWGGNTVQWRPERFMDGNKTTEQHKTGLGVYANLSGSYSVLQGNATLTYPQSYFQQRCAQLHRVRVVSCCVTTPWLINLYRWRFAYIHPIFLASAIN